MVGTKQKSQGKKKYTYGDYLTWPDDERWEILDGEAFDMTPAPTTDHQRISRELCAVIHAFLVGKTCEMFDAPVDVLFPKSDEADEQVTTVLQPDVLVVCDPAKVTPRGIRGAPDFVIEILSPSTASKDLIRKRRLYEIHGVKEFWTIHPTDRMVTVYRRDAGGATFGPAEILDGNDLVLDVQCLPGLAIEFNKILPRPPKIVRESPREYRVR